MFQTSTCHSCNDLHGAGLARSGCAGERDARSRSFSLPVVDLHRDGRLPSPPFPLCSKKGGGWKKTKRGLLAHESWSRTIYVKAKLAHTTFTSMAAWQQACQTSCKMHCYASLLHPAGPQTASLRAQSTERTACSTLCTSVRSICKTCRRRFLLLLRSTWLLLS